MGNPFAIPNTSNWPPITGTSAVGTGRTGTAGTAGGSGVTTGGSTPYQNDMNNFFASIAGWNGAPRYQEGERALDFSA